MLARVLTALVGISFLIVLIDFGSPRQFSLFIFIVTLGSLWEYFSIAFPDRWRERLLGIAFGTLVSLVVILPGLPEPGLFLATVLAGVFSTYLFLSGDLEERYKHLGWTLSGVFYVGYLFPHFVPIARAAEGTRWVFFVLLVVAAGDTAGYFLGMAMGERKLYAQISPRKTVLGAAGSLGASLIAGVAGAAFLLTAVTWLEAVFLSCALSLLGQVGDLFESWVKRVFSVKDSGRLLPGHGGLLDRIDSLILPAVFTVYYVRLFHS